ncbi:MAG TPA: hypothetical protein VMH22_14230 [bacterium]|nr:hypothetical protein [bacterium]
MTGRSMNLGALLLLAAAAAGCSSATIQQMQQANQSYSIAPDFKLDRTWRIAVLPPHNGDEELSSLYDRAGLLMMKPGCFVLIDRTEVMRILQEQWSGGPRILEPRDVRRLGQSMGAEAVVTVDVTRLEHNDFFKDNPEQREAKLFVKIISVRNAEVLYYAEGQGSSFDGPDAALSGALDMALAPLIQNGKGQSR